MFPSLAGWLFLAVTFLGILPSAAAATSEGAPAKADRIAAEQRKEFLAGARDSAREQAKVSEDFWAWIAMHPEVETGLLVARSPMPAVFAENLDAMRRAVGPEMADKYAHLLLAVSLRDAAFAPARDKPEASPEVLKMAAWIKASGTSYLAVMADQASALASAGVPASAAAGKKSGFWQEVAIASGTYPPRIEQTVPAFVEGLIARLESPAPEGTKEKWPLFPVAKTPYPLLPWLGRTISARECDWVWDHYFKSGLINYGRYSWDYDRVPEVKFKSSDWHPSSLPRIKEDGGVCGRLSTIAEVFRVVLGVPALGIGQPGHRALLHYTVDPKTGTYGVKMMQGIAGVDQSRLIFKEGGLGGTGEEGYLGHEAIRAYATASAMNLGLARYQDALIARHLAAAAADEESKRKFLEISARSNPYLPEVWKMLADLAGNDPKACAGVLREMDARLLDPDSADSVESRDLPADTDLSKVAEPKEPGRQAKNYGREVARIFGDRLATEMFGRILNAKTGAAEARDVLAAEIARREAIKLGYGPEVSTLLQRYDIALGKIDAVRDLAAATISTADTASKKGKKQAVDSALMLTKAVADAMPAPAAGEWLGSLLAALDAAAPRFSAGKNGKPQAEELFAGLHKIRMQALRRPGVAPGAAKTAQNDYDDRLAAFSPAAWPAVDQTSRPWAFNWWLGSAVDQENLARELKRYADAGLGGIHIIPIYAAKGMEGRNIEYLSPKWMEMLDFAVREGAKLGLGVDMTTGTGWCFGGPTITPELGGRKLVLKRFPFPADGKLPKEFDRKKVVIERVEAFGPDGQRQNLTDQIKEDGTMAWKPPGTGWNVISLGHASSGMKVKRASPGGAGLMIDPFNKLAMETFLAPFTKAFDRPGAAKPRAMYHDSYEYYGADWTPDLLEAFAKRRGYRLEDELEAFAGVGDPDRVERVRCDYRETLSDLMIEDVFPLWADWCKKRGILTRNQAHGAPVNLLDFYNIADIPETEMFGHGGPDPLVSGFDADLGKADREPLLSKFASSAAHTAGKKLTSAETGTWLAEHFCETWEELKGLVDLMFLSGINHIFYHGCAYSPDHVPWPGWLFYAATEMNPRNPLWREVPALNKYIERSQSILQAGVPDNDILLYWPVHEIWSKGTTYQFTVHKREWLEGEATGAAARFLWDAGYGFDYVSDRLLKPMKSADGRIQGSSGVSWRAVLVPECRELPLATWDKLLALAAGGATILFENRLPDDVPGLGALADRRAALQAALGKLSFEEPNDGVREAIVGKGRILVGPIKPLLAASGIPRESLVDHPGVKFLRRKIDGGTAYLIVNHSTAALDGWLPLAAPAAQVVAMDALSGTTGSVPLRKGSGGNSEVNVRIEPGHSLILRAFAEETGAIPPFSVPKPGERLLTMKGPWRVRFVSGGPTLPKALETTELKPWGSNGDPAAKAFSGSAVYEATFDVPESSDLNAPLVLDLGDVRNVARVAVNDSELGSLIMRPFRVPLPSGILKKQGNTIRVEVTNLGANRLSDLDRRKVVWRVFNDINFASITYKPFDASKWTVFESGLLGPVEIRKVAPPDPNPH